MCVPFVCGQARCEPLDLCSRRFSDSNCALGRLGVLTGMGAGNVVGEMGSWVRGLAFGGAVLGQVFLRCDSSP